MEGRHYTHQQTELPVNLVKEGSDDDQTIHSIKQTYTNKGHTTDLQFRSTVPNYQALKKSFITLHFKSEHSPLLIFTNSGNE